MKTTLLNEKTFLYISYKARNKKAGLHFGRYMFQRYLKTAHNRRIGKACGSSSIRTLQIVYIRQTGEFILRPSVTTAIITEEPSKPK